jgi:hypothetical protein
VSDARRITLSAEVPWNAEDIAVVCGAYIVLNQHELRRYPQAPWLYQAGIPYHSEPIRGVSKWVTFRELLKDPKWANCKNLATWRAAEIRERLGQRAVTKVLQENDHTMHVVVEWPNGDIEDPSVVLGMGKVRRG